MAKGIVKCICGKCGDEFKVEKYYFSNRAAADEWEEYAKENYDECPKCYRIRVTAENENKLAKYSLPTIEGVSEKQIRYAENLRTKYLAKHEYLIERVQTLIEYTKKDDYSKKCEEFGKSPTEALNEYLAAKGLTEVYIGMSETKASKIIDALKVLAL